MRWVALSIPMFLCSLVALRSADRTVPDNLQQRALGLHHSLLTVDTHCDTPLILANKGWNIGVRHPGGTLIGGDQDLPRMKEGGLAASFFAVFLSQGPRTPEGFDKARKAALSTLDSLDLMFKQHSDQCEKALTPSDAVRIHKTGKRAIFLGLENGYPIGKDLSLVNRFYKRGIRYITLCHSINNDLCASSTARHNGLTVARTTPDTGLTEFGAQVVRRMNQLGIIVDVSHISEKSVSDVLKVSRAPVMASHSGARAVGDHPRNLTDEQLRALKKNGGVVQVCLVSPFLKPESTDKDVWKKFSNLWKRSEQYYHAQAAGEDPAMDAAFEKEYQELLKQDPLFKATIRDLVDHIDHVVKVIGVDHVGIGSDFDGGGGLADCRDVTAFPGITQELLRRGYSEKDIRKIWGGNAMRVFDEVIAKARELRQR